MKAFMTSILMFAFCVIVPFRAFADAKTDLEDRFYPVFHTDEDMKDMRPGQNLLNKGIQFGAWVTPTFIDERSALNYNSTTITTVRLWMKAYLWDNSYIYLRGKDTFTGVISGSGYKQSDAYYTNLLTMVSNPALYTPANVLYTAVSTRAKIPQKTNNLADLDLGYLAMNILDNTIQLYAGRKYFILGSGLVMNGRADGAEVDVYTAFVNLKLFGAYSGLLEKDDNPYGLSDRDISDGANRWFGGGELSYDFYNQTAYILGMAQYDFGNQLAGLKSRYNSQYYGAGLKGVLFKNLSYGGEIINERGTSYINSLSTSRITQLVLSQIITTFPYSVMNQKTSINALGANFSMYYFFETMLNPVLIAQYTFGSGDSDRANYKSPNGNTQGTDKAFIPFGTFVGGYALRPLIGNLHTLRAGFAVSPFEWSDIDYIRSMTLIVKYSYYMKNKGIAPINYGGEATKNNREVGHGIDLSLRWLVLSDVSMFVNYALFLPGAAYVDKGQAFRQFTMVGLNFSF